MIKLFYQFLTFFTRFLGSWFFKVFSRFVSFGYFILFPSRVGIGIRFYRALFPERGGLHALLCTWRQFHGFTDVFLDRFLLQANNEIAYTSEGWELLERAAADGTGGIVLMSHMGNWDVAAHLLRMRGLRLLLYMGAREKEQIEKMQKESLAESGLSIVSVGEDGGSPFDILEALRFLREGGLVSLTGDRLWTPGQRAVPVRFLGHRARLPEAPHRIALLSGAPLFLFFAFRTGPSAYHFSISGPITVTAPSRADRDRVIRESAQRYADILAEKAREHPRQWYHFESFLGERFD
ncbi:MAG: lysophospholipid acyltransferase family protein [Spirochaetes bacterium]|nr:lysophospholipid acyltransferase family protein [Spirochaetota bacterium]